MKKQIQIDQWTIETEKKTMTIIKTFMLSNFVSHIYDEYKWGRKQKTSNTFNWHWIIYVTQQLLTGETKYWNKICEQVREMLSVNSESKMMRQEQLSFSNSFYSNSLSSLDIHITHFCGHLLKRSTLARVFKYSIWLTRKVFDNVESDLRNHSCYVQVYIFSSHNEYEHILFGLTVGQD